MEEVAWALGPSSKAATPRGPSCDAATQFDGRSCPGPAGPAAAPPEWLRAARACKLELRSGHPALVVIDVRNFPLVFVPAPKIQEGCKHTKTSICCLREITAIIK